MKTTQITALLLSTFLTSLSQAADEYYKWVDERGVTHYSQNLPDDKNVKPETVNVSTFVPRDSGQAIQQLQQQRTEKAEAKKEGVTKTGAKTKVDVSKAPADYKAKCTTLKQDLAALTEKGNSIRLKEANGEVRKLTAEEVAKRTDETKREIKAYCE